MKISQEDAILIKNLCQSSMVHESCWVNCPTTVGNLEALTVCWRESARRVQLFGEKQWRTLCSVTRTSQKGNDQLVRFRMKLPIPVQVCTG